MKTLHVFTLSALALAALPAIALGCGGTTDDSARADAGPALDAASVDAASVDAGAPDARSADAGLRDTGAPQNPADASCVRGPSILDAGLPDAALTPDGGNTGECVACLTGECTAEVADCDSECACNVAANQLFACLNSGQPVFSCAQQVGVGTSPALQSLGQCALTATKCRAPCGINFP